MHVQSTKPSTHRPLRWPILLLELASWIGEKAMALERTQTSNGNCTFDRELVAFNPDSIWATRTGGAFVAVALLAISPYSEQCAEGR